MRVEQESREGMQVEKARVEKEFDRGGLNMGVEHSLSFHCSFIILAIISLFIHNSRIAHYILS